jgi:hypothetical protein
MSRTNPLLKVLATAVGAVVISGAVTLPALAALGGDAASVDADVAKMKGQKRSVVATGGYTVSEITLPSGTVVREYVSAEGKVFAASWSGAVMPDMQQTLGTYFEQYKAAVATTASRGHHHLHVQQPDLVVTTRGHMRAWRGAAYVPSLLPPNFSLEEIK